MGNVFDVIVAGGGPAGSTAATLLAQQGHRVLLIEQDRHPRFHIGESMMPFIEPVMQRLGIDWSLGNQNKDGADFIDEARGKNLYFSLQDRYRTYQIDRAEFDRKLFENAMAQGVSAHQQEKVIEVDCSSEGVRVKTDRDQYQGRYLIDATGRNALMGKKLKTIKKLKNFGQYALYQHYQLQDIEPVRQLFKTGNIQVLLRDIGWNWVIPLAGRRLSLGLVVHRPGDTTLKGLDLLQSYIDSSAILTDLLEGASVIRGLELEADFSYINRKRYGLRFACCGDASGFLDPVFSSGFYFAVKTAETLADRLHEALETCSEHNEDFLAEGDALYHHGFESMFLLIERFYSSSIVNNLVFEADRHQRIKQEITALLSGELWNEGNLFQQGMLKGRRNTALNELK